MCLYSKSCYRDDNELHYKNPLIYYLPSKVKSSNTYTVVGYWLDMELYVRDLVRSNYAPEQGDIFLYPANNLFITYALLSQKALCYLL